jgi:hypothetical protein
MLLCHKYNFSLSLYHNKWQSANMVSRVRMAWKMGRGLGFE